MDRIYIYQSIANYLKQNGIQQSFVSDRLGIKRQSFGQSLKGRRRISVDEYKRICDILGLSYDYFYLKSKQKGELK